MENKTYQGKRTPDEQWIVTVNGQLLDPGPSLTLRNHSPNGFAWGYAGSGPSQLALAILLDHYRDAYLAQRLYQEFKFATVALWSPDGWTITSEEIDEVCNKWKEDDGATR
jgi:hypothetical protein